MRRPVLVAIALGLLAWPPAPRANIGGYSFGVTTGNLTPFQASGTEHVRILEEQLDIALRRTDASVSVRYTMRNLAGTPVRVRFGFPVEAETWADDEDPPRDQAEIDARRSKRSLRAIQQLKGYTVTAGGARIRSEYQSESVSIAGAGPLSVPSELRNIAGWMVSEVTFPAGAVESVEVRYSADYRGEFRSVSEDIHWSPRSFGYRLSTGAVWNGTIVKGTVTIRSDGIPAEEVEIVAPRERFKRDGDRWVWAFQNMKPTLADDLVLRAIPGFFEMGGRGYLAEGTGLRSYLERGGAWAEGHQRFKARASSTLAPVSNHTFGAEHLAELEPTAPWAEGVPGNGVGEWVELEPAQARPLLALVIRPGFRPPYGHPELFEQNGRPSRVEIILNGEHRFSATLGDAPSAQLIPVLRYAKPVSKLRITILDVYPGSRYADTCISGVVLYDRLKEKPDVRGAR